MSRPRKIRPREPGYRFGHDPMTDRELLAWCLEAVWLHRFLREGIPTRQARREAVSRALRFYNKPYGVSPDAVQALIDDTEPTLQNRRTVHLNRDGCTSLQINTVLDDRGREALVSVVDCVPLEGDSGGRGRVLYTYAEEAAARKATVRGPDAHLDPLDRAGGLPASLDYDHPPRGLRLFRPVGTMTEDTYKRRKRDHAPRSLWVEQHHDLPGSHAWRWGAIQYAKGHRGKIRDAIVRNIKSALPGDFSGLGTEEFLRHAEADLNAWRRTEP